MSITQTSWSCGLIADRQPLKAFKARDPRFPTRQLPPDGIELNLFEWCENAAHGLEKCGLKSVQQLELASEGIVRVILAPRDIPAPGKTDGLAELFEICSVPSAFIDEGLRAVSQSFAAQEDIDGTLYIWFHLLCKTLVMVEPNTAHTEGSADDGDSEDKGRKAARAQSQADFSWIKPGIVLRIRKHSKTSTKPVRTSTTDSDDTLTATSSANGKLNTMPNKAKVELVCFGGPSALNDRLRAVVETFKCDDLLDDPYMLLSIVFEEMFKILDSTTWAVADRFGVLETQTLGLASQPGKASKELSKDHFTGLHNLAKHAIYLRENCEAALATLNDFYNHYKTTMNKDPSAPQRRTRQALEYQKTLFESTQRRLASLNARISNIIQLSFHIVTQGDSKLMQSENQSMKTIAVMTLVFMPLGTVASIFGSQFMKLQDERPYHLTVSRDFWLMWVIAVPLTVGVLTIWWVWYMKAKARLVDGTDKPKHDYMGWKMLPQTLRRVKARKGMPNA